MTTVVYHQYSNIPNMSGSYASAPVSGPLSTSQTPNQLNTHNSGVLTGINPNPPQFYPADGASVFSNARSQYKRTNTTANNFSRGTQMYSSIPSTSYYSADLKRQFNVSQSTKYVAPASSGMYLAAKKSAAVGKSSMKKGLPVTSALSYKNYNKNDSKTALQRARSGGCVSPAKKGSLFNIDSTVNLSMTPTSVVPLYDYNPMLNDVRIALSGNNTFANFALAGYALNLTTNLTELETVLSRVDDSTEGDYKEFFDKVNYLVAQFSA